MSDRGGYIGRFAPSPTGPLHAGSLVAALASWLDARAHGGTWLVRIEDTDTPRCVFGMDQIILRQLADCAMVPDEPPLYQSARSNLYQPALDRLVASEQAFPCACTRQDIANALAATGQPHARHGELVYPGTCRHGLNGKKARSWRFLIQNSERKSPAAQQIRALLAPDSIAGKTVKWHDRRMGQQAQDVGREVGDFVLQRADGLWAYQLAVVVDDAAQGITHIVRGEDLADNTARQILLQRALGVPTPTYLHTPLVVGENGEKLSKQNGAQAVDTCDPVLALQHAGGVLGIAVPPNASSAAAWLQQAIPAWRDLHLKIDQ